MAQYDYLDDGTRMTEAEILDALLLSPRSMRAFYREASYGLLDIEVVELLDAITELHPASDGCSPNQEHMLIEVDEDLEPDPYWPDIDHHLGLVHNNCDVARSTFGNLAGWPTSSHGMQYMPVATMNAVAYDRDFSGLTSSTWAHEIGHGLGVPLHAQAYVCSANGPLSDDPDDCVNVAVGHQHDIMGSRHAGTHFNGHFKDWLGWIDAANKTTIQDDGCYFVTLHDLARPADGGSSQLVVIDLVEAIPARTAIGWDIVFDKITLEFRGHTGFDERAYKSVPLAGGGDRNVTAEVNAFGILVQALLCESASDPWPAWYPCVPYEIDMQPNTMDDTTNPAFWDPIDGFLLEGKTWDVPRNPITVRVLDTRDAPVSIEILVEYGTAGSTWYRDADGDGFGDPIGAEVACVQPLGYVVNADDCDDASEDTYPGAPEVHDGRDNQCSGDDGHGAVDEISATAGFYDGPDKTRYSWDAQPGATLYEVARSTMRDHSADCWTVETAQSSWTDAEIPGSGGAYYYLTRTVAPFVGSWGQDSTGSERVAVCP